MKSFAKKILIFITVMLLVAGAGWFGRKAYKNSAQRRLVAQARDYLAKKDFRNTALCVQRALQLNPINPGATEIMADMLEEAGAPAALGWRTRAAKLEPENIHQRFHWAETAIKMHDVASATEALEGVDDHAKNTADYYKLKGALAWSVRDTDGAEKEYLEAARLEPGSQTIQLNLATIRLTSTNQNVVQAARVSLQEITTNASFRLAALHQLLIDAIAHKQPEPALGYSRQIVKDPSALFSDKIDYLELLRENKSPEYSNWLASLEKDSTTTSANAFALGHWKATTGNPADALQWLKSLPLQLQTNQPVPLVITDCQMAVKDWKGILAGIDRADWGEANYYKLALQSLAERSLGQSAAADVSWRKALRVSAHRLDRLSRLAEITGVWKWTSEKSEVLTQIIDEYPQETWAIDQLAGQLYASGKTLEMENLFSRIYSKDPSNIRLKNNLANLYLLRKTELPKAYEMAKDAYSSSTNNPFFASTYAYSLLLQNKSDEALKIVNGLKAEYLKIPSVALYYGVIQAQAGHKDISREALKRAQNGNLLPEERAIVQLAEARM
jgi:predicted Zn-dependent protease